MIITIFAPTIWVYCVFTAPIIPCQFLKNPLQIVEDKGAKLRRKAVIIIIRDQVYVSSGLIICSKKHARSKNQFCNWEFRQCSVCSTIINLYKLQELGYKERVKISDFFCFDVKGCLDSLWLSLCTSNVRTTGQLVDSESRAFNPYYCSRNMFWNDIHHESQRDIDKISCQNLSSKLHWERFSDARTIFRDWWQDKPISSTQTCPKRPAFHKVFQPIESLEKSIQLTS